MNNSCKSKVKMHLVYQNILPPPKKKKKSIKRRLFSQHKLAETASHQTIFCIRSALNFFFPWQIIFVLLFSRKDTLLHFTKAALGNHDFVDLLASSMQEMCSCSPLEGLLKCLVAVQAVSGCPGSKPDLRWVP